MNEASVNPEALRAAARRIDVSIRNLQSKQKSINVAVQALRNSWMDAQSKQNLERIETLFKLVEKEIRVNEHVSQRLKRKAALLEKYLRYH